MSTDSSNHVTALLQRWAQGDEAAFGDLVPLVYQELRRLAHHRLRSQRADHTLQSTALVNEAFLRLLGSEPAQLQNRAHFVAVSSRLMRQILVDYMRRRTADKRDGGFRIDIEALADLPVQGDAQVLALDEALESLSQQDDRQARIVEMKFFGGLTAPEIAEVLGVSLTTVERDWAVARLWLRRQMGAVSANKSGS
jgi:RNA polymerase sigma factor (TIGR02999 family)